MAETARKAFVATLVTVGVVILVLALWKLRLVVALALRRLHHRGSDQAEHRCAAETRGPALGRSDHPLRDLRRPHRLGALARGAARAQPGDGSGREPAADAPRNRRRGEAVVGDQTGDFAQPAAATEGGSQRSRALLDAEDDRHDCLRGRRRDLLRACRRRLLDLRTRPGDQRGDRALTTRGSGKSCAIHGC